MRNFHWHCRGLILGSALVTLGCTLANPTQCFTLEPNDSDALVAPQAAHHAPMIRLFGPNGRPILGTHGEVTTGNWSGYQVTGGTYTSAQLTWTVPAVTYTSYPGTSPAIEWSSTWVGIGGSTDTTLIQLGTEQDTTRTGAPAYFAWYEVLPAAETPLSTSQYPVSPGDLMSASLLCITNCTPNVQQSWFLAMSNLTRGWTFTLSINYTSSLASAEWIMEATTNLAAPPVITPLPSYFETIFSGALVNGGVPSLTLASNGVILNDPNGGVSNPCPAVAGTQGDRFITVYGTLTCPAPTAVAGHDFDGNGKSDIAWADTSNDIAMWLMNGAAISSSPGIGNVGGGWQMVGQHDFNGDGRADLLWRNSAGDLVMWFMNGGQIVQNPGLGNVPLNWFVDGLGDFNGDGRSDILLARPRRRRRDLVHGRQSPPLNPSLGNVPTNWFIVGVGDFDGDGDADILWRDSTNGDLQIWFMRGAVINGVADFGFIPVTWNVAGVGDFNGDGHSDIIWSDGAGNLAIWLLRGSTILSSQLVGNVGTSWFILGVGDYNGDGKSDILWRDTHGDIAMWFMNGTTYLSDPGLETYPPAG